MADEGAVNVDEWVYGERIPENIPSPVSPRIAEVDETVVKWSAGEIATADLPWNDWGYTERYRFISNIDPDVNAAQLAEMDASFKVIETGNNEVLFAWLKESVLKKYDASYPRMERFLIEVGRRKFLTPLYEAMVETGQGDLARKIYDQARPNYHSVSRGTMDALLGTPN